MPVTSNFVLGGLTAVIWTDFIQTCIMVVGALGLMVLGLYVTPSQSNDKFIYNLNVFRVLILCENQSQIHLEIFMRHK